MQRLFMNLSPVEQNELLEKVNKCTNLSTAKIICDLYEIPYNLLNFNIEPNQSIDLFIKDKDFHMLKIKSVYQDYVLYCLNNNYNIETQNMFTRTVKKKLGCFTKGKYFMTKEESSLENVKAFVLANEKYIEECAVSGVYDAYLHFCTENNYYAASLTQFGRDMSKLGYKTYPRRCMGNIFNFYKKI